MKSWTVKLKETYADGYVWDTKIEQFAARADVALRSGLAWNTRSGGIKGHGPVVRVEASAEASDGS